MIDSNSEFTNYNIIKNHYSDIKIGDIKHSITSDYTPWMGKENNKMVSWCSQAFTKCGITPTISDGIGGNEPTWWQRCNDNLHCAIIGPTIKDAHSTKETLHINTIQPIMDVCKFLFQKMGEQ